MQLTGEFSQTIDLYISIQAAKITGRYIYIENINVFFCRDIHIFQIDIEKVGLCVCGVVYAFGGK